MTLCGLFTALIAVGAFIQIPFPLVPFTLQTLFVVMAALLLGPQYASLSVGLYLLLGLSGLPVFTKGGGPAYILQPTFGYLLGFLAAVWLVGALGRKIAAKSGVTNGGAAGGALSPRSLVLRYWCAGMAGIAVVYATGMIYLVLIMRFYMNTPVGFAALFTVNFFLTAAGDLFKCFVAALLTVRLRPILAKTSGFWG